MKAIEIQLFKVKSNIPLLFKDEIVFWNGKILTKENTFVLPYDPIRDSNFFVEYVEPKFKTGKRVSLIKIAKFKFCNLSGRPDFGCNTFKVNPTTSFVIISFTTTKYVLKEENGLGYILADEDNLKLVIDWFFVNTDGKINSLVVGKTPYKEAFCKSIGNYHPTKEACSEWIAKIQKSLSK